MKFTPKIKENRWDIAVERELLKKWLKENIHKFNLKSKKKIFSIDTPPPYPSGKPWHIGAAAHYSQIDMIARTAKMKNFEVYFPIGIDRNGVPVEKYTEKKYGIKLQETPREKFIELCKVALDDVEAYFVSIMKRMGMSGDFENYYRTDKEEYRQLTQATFIEMWDKGLVYEATRPNNYCTECGTTIADADIEYEELSTWLVYIKFKLKGTDQSLTIATTRPEFLSACQTIIVHPDDVRYTELQGMKAIIPIYKREVSIITNRAAKPEFGSGIAMVCSYGDYSDVRLFRELGLKEIIAIDEKGRMTKVAGKYAGLPVVEARKKIIEDLEKEGLVEKKENIMHRTPICDRSKTPIEIISMKEFYLKQIDFLSRIRKIAEKLIFHPEEHRQLLLNWIDSVVIDWPITRRRFYGTDVPIWYCKKCGKPNLPKPGKYYQPWKEKPPFKKCKFCDGKEFIGETRTFDTWFDSSISPLFISKYMKDNNFFKKTFPNSLRSQGKDIVRTWLYYTILRCYQLTGKQPWQHAWVMGYGVDEKGERMSKSKGNVIDPLPTLEKYGADNFRFWNAAEVSLGYDFRCSEQRIEGASKFLTKLWNISRFISAFPEPKKVKLTKTDEWMLGELNNLVKDCLKGYEELNFFVPTNKIREFTWNFFAAHYLELVKARAYGQGFSKSEQQSAWFTLHTCMKTILLLLAPITPFITDHLWRKLYSKRSIHFEQFPKPEWETKLTRLTKKILDFNSAVWDTKKKRSLSLKDEIEVNVPIGLKEFEKDLIAMHNIKK